MQNSTTNPLFADLEAATAELVRMAGGVALQYFRQVNSEVKPDGSIVTDADRAVEQFLFDTISNRWPDSTFIGEEAEYRKGGSLLWVVDPIDGTAIFAVGAPTWTVSIAVFVDGEPVTSAVYCPVTDELFAISAGKFCLNGRQKKPAEFIPSPRSVLYVPSNFATRYHIADYDGKTRNLGSGCLHIAYVMAGRGDAVVLRGHVWDIAPAFSFLRNTAGVISDLSGLRINAKDVLDIERQKIEFPVVISSCPESAEFFCKRISYPVK